MQSLPDSPRPLHALAEPTGRPKNAREAIAMYSPWLAAMRWTYVTVDGRRQSEPIAVDPILGRVWVDLRYPLGELSHALGRLLGPPIKRAGKLIGDLNIRHSADHRAHCPCCHRNFCGCIDAVAHVQAVHGLACPDVGFDHREWDLRGLLTPPLRMTIERSEDGRCRCPACSLTFKWVGRALESHMGCRHDLEMRDFMTEGGVL